MHCSHCPLLILFFSPSYMSFAQFALSVTLKTPCWEVLGMGDYYSEVNWALALQPLSAINPFFLTILYVICWLTFEAIINIWLWENEQIRHSLPSNCKQGDFLTLIFKVQKGLYNLANILFFQFLVTIRLNWYWSKSLCPI